MRIEDAYDEAHFRASAGAVVEALAESLARSARRDGPVLPWLSPEDSARLWASDFAGGDALSELIERVIETSHHLHHPRYVGHQVSAPLPLAALCDAASALLNNGMAVYEMGPAATAIERAVVEWMSTKLGHGAGAGGILTSGGSAGNLTALLAARQAKAGFDVWTKGAHAGPPLAILCGETAHYSIARAAEIMGIGAEGVFAVACDQRFRMLPAALDNALACARAAERKPFALVASAGSTATGAYDPLDAAADFAERHQLWLHVDGAHGAAAALSPALRARVAGIERADSVVWDAHKMMMMPSLVTAVLFKHARSGYQAFAQDASYLFNGLVHGDAAEPPWWDVGLRTLECTKLMVGLKVYVCLRVYGEAFFAGHVERMFEQAARFAERVAARADFELATEPEANIVCFRKRPPGVTGAALDAVQARVRQELVRSGQFYLVQTRLPAGVFLRTALMNPLTTDADLDQLLDAVSASARDADGTLVRTIG